MRRFDKKNIVKRANVLAEQRYLTDKFPVNESKKTESQALTILNSNQVDGADKVLSALIGIDKSINQKNLPIMAYFVVKGEKNTNNIASVFNDYNDLETNKRIKPLQYTKNGVVIGDKTFTEFIPFSEYVHGEKNKFASPTKGASVEADFEAKEKPLWSGNNIDIYDGLDVGRCIKYTQGGLTGKGYGFCIGQPGNTMYQSYRDSKDSSFYFIIDKNRFNTEEDGSVNLDDPLHIVVLDNTKYGIELTDADNSTGKISEYYDDVESYLDYLKSNGVPVDKLVNKTKSPEESEEEELLGQENDDLDWFIKLPFDMKSKYIGRGHKLTDAQFDYLIGNN